MPVSSYNEVTSLCRCSPVSEARKVFVYVNCGTYTAKSYLLAVLNEYPSFIVFNFEYVHKILFLCGNLSYNLSLSCRFKVELIFNGARYNKKNGINIFNHKFVYHKILKILKITDMQNMQKIYTPYSVYKV